MQRIRLFNCKKNEEYFCNDSFAHKSIYENMKKNAGLYFSIKPIQESSDLLDPDKPDFLALDDDLSPVAVLFQQSQDTNVVAKGVHCLDRLVRNPDIYYDILSKEYPEISDDTINWQDARILCIAHDFPIYDQYLVAQLNRNIELIRYAVYPGDLLLFESINPQIHTEDSPPVEMNRLPVKSSEQDIKKIHIDLSTNPPSVTFTGAIDNEPELKPVKKQLKENAGLNKRKNNICGIGYCMIKNNRHYAVFPNNERVEIKDLPDYIYLAEGQFVLIDQYGCFKYAYGHIMEDSPFKSAIDSFATVYINESGTYIDKGDSIKRKLINYSNIRIRNKTIVSVDRSNRFIRYYKPIKHVADSFMTSVKAKGHQMVFVMGISEEGVCLRDVETGREYIKSFDQKNAKLQKNHVLCLDGEKIVTAFSTSKFYTLSSYYNQIRYGAVELDQDSVYLKILNGERVPINNPPGNLEEGQVVYVDEFYNYCGTVDNVEDYENNLTVKNVTGIRSYKKSEKNENEEKAEKVEIKGKALVLGNNTYANSYKLSLLKCGYLARVLEGYEPWAKIKAEIRDADIIVVVTSHISHENMQRVKKDVTDIPVIYSEFDGANRVQTQILAKLQESLLIADSEA